MRENLKILKNFIEFRGCGTVVEDAFKEIANALGEEFLDITDEYLEQMGELLYDLRQVISSSKKSLRHVSMMYDIQESTKEIIEDVAKSLVEDIDKDDVQWYLEKAQRHLNGNYVRELYGFGSISPNLILHDLEKISDNAEYISIAFLEAAYYLALRESF